MLADVGLMPGTWPDFPQWWQPQDLRPTAVLACCPFRSHQHTWALSSLRWHVHLEYS